MSDGIEDIIDDLYEKSIINFEKSQGTRKNIHVSDLTDDCMRKAWYRINGHKQDDKDFKKALPLVHGTQLHECCNLGGVEHEMSLAGNIFKMERVDYSKDQHKDFYETIQGSMDDLIEIDDELIICDKKTTKKSIPREVSDKYKEQMNIYKLLYFIETGVEISRAAIIYIDKSSAWERHKTRVFDLDSIEEIRKRRSLFHQE
jgi:CRISPR/Cas system-associated exonuclease Cas4 (RecB family)